MNLAILKQHLQVTTGTQIGEVLFDWKEITNSNHAKVYPIVLWVLDGLKAEGDMRSTTIQQEDTFTFQVFVIAHIDLNANEDKITIWDTLMGQFKTYLNAMNDSSNLKIENIDKIKWRYVPEKMISADSEVGLLLDEVIVKTFCNA